MDLQGVSPIGQQVARYRKVAKLSAEDLAQRSGEGLTRSVIANLENGRKDDVTVKQLLALSAALHVPPALLIADVFDPGKPSPYPLPERAGIVPEDDEEHHNNAALLGWIGGLTFRTKLPADNQATRVAYDAFTSVRSYLQAMARFRRLVREFALARERRDELPDEFLEQAVQAAADVVLQGITAMERAQVSLSGASTAKVHSLLASVGLAFDSNPFGDPQFDG